MKREIKRENWSGLSDTEVTLINLFGIGLSIGLMILLVLILK
jgi:hypothetical protein